jgi:CRISPR-associated endonuclease/helicase Cas3
MEEMELILDRLKLDGAHTEALPTAAAKHDWGKAHPVFQKALHRNDDSSQLLAKQVSSHAHHERKHFRHELASVLSMVGTGDSDLAAYLAAAHHGKVRLGIRSMPGEQEKDQIRTARGIHEGDQLPGCELAPGVFVPPVQLSLAIMDFGAGGSWTERMLRLRDKLGPFCLTYLEMLLRMADDDASEHPRLEAASCPQ